MTTTDRVHGSLSKWNDGRGFGFVTLARGSVDVFVHISAFPSGGARPQVGELISFRVQTGPDGRQRAVDVMRPGHRRLSRPPRREPARRPVTMGLRMLALVATAVAGFHAYRAYDAGSVTPAAPVEVLGSGMASPDAATLQFSCDGRAHCDDMRSCEEATYFLGHCPRTKMDGDYDGIPCEDQWCNTP